jgi:hypothetical protein
VNAQRLSANVYRFVSGQFGGCVKGDFLALICRALRIRE